MCAGQRCPNSVLHGSNGQWNCPYLQIGGGGLNGSMSDGTDVPLWLSCADPADPAMRWQNHSYLLNPHYYRQVAYDASAWRARDEWNILVPTPGNIYVNLGFFTRRLSTVSDPILPVS